MAIPQYAEGVPRHRLVKILCRGECGAKRFAEVSKTPWGKSGSNVDPQLFATYLRCRYKARDNYNWQRV